MNFLTKNKKQIKIIILTICIALPTIMIAILLNTNEENIVVESFKIDCIRAVVVCLFLFIFVKYFDRKK